MTEATILKDSKMKQYHWWWLITTAVSVFIGANYVMFALTGLMLITPTSLEQGMMQFFVFLCTTIVSAFCVEAGCHKKE